MSAETDTWALILAAGDGTRLRSLTTGPSGSPVPKQYCSLHHGPSLLHEAVLRAGAVASRARTCAVVAEQHRGWWSRVLAALPERNVISQPANRGTAIGILLPLLYIVERDPDARIVLLPADHHVRREGVLAASLRKAVEQLDRHPDEVLLLGLHPEEPDPELGYILPGASDGDGALRVSRFIEKPDAVQAQTLVDGGALWNAFIVASTARALLDMFRRRMPALPACMHTAIRSDGIRGGGAVAGLYRDLDPVDFSRHVLAGEETSLRVLPVAPCGWSDLGTPGRVAEALRATSRTLDDRQVPETSLSAAGFLSLAAQHELLAATRGLHPACRHGESIP
jgi:mannose-1-phosphate guanylyltransferase